MSQDTPPEPPKQVLLTKPERLEIQNLNLQRDNIQLQAGAALEKLQAEMNEVARQINERLGVHIEHYRVDFKTGVATYDPALAGIGATDQPPPLPVTPQGKPQE